MGYSALRRKKRGKRERKMGERETEREKGRASFLLVPHRERKREKKRERKN